MSLKDAIKPINSYNKISNNCINITRNYGDWEIELDVCIDETLRRLNDRGTSESLTSQVSTQVIIQETIQEKLLSVADVLVIHEQHETKNTANAINTELLTTNQEKPELDRETVGGKTVSR
ncbi:hypothetical protein [Vulcanisaeta distributa]|uniref:hypothetical protein n=1 Tax=Vulcanisaeta distributa TaxID=164451 RepID=UPI0006CF5A58|nr:hypothetical protein [Vulcanisaeta distributa]